MKTKNKISAILSKVIFNIGAFLITIIPFLSAERRLRMSYQLMNVVFGEWYVATTKLMGFKELLKNEWKPDYKYFPYFQYDTAENKMKLWDVCHVDKDIKEYSLCFESKEMAEYFSKNVLTSKMYNDYLLG